MRRLAVILIPLCLLACSDADRGRSGTIFPEGLELKAGDVVFRRGLGFTSQAVILAEGGGAYSHTGLVIDSAGHPMIVHAVPGEPDYKGDEDRVKMDTPTEYFLKTAHRREPSIVIKTVQPHGKLPNGCCRCMADDHSSITTTTIATPRDFTVRNW